MKTFSTTELILSWSLRLLAAAILLQTLYFKFTAAPESVYIFDKVGLGTPGRLGSGTAELIASILLFVPGATWLGAGLALVVISGAIMSHLTTLGLVVMNDGGLLFILALITWVSAAGVLFLHRAEIPYLRSVPIIGPELVKWQ